MGAQNDIVIKDTNMVINVGPKPAFTCNKQMIKLENYSHGTITSPPNCQFYFKSSYHNTPKMHLSAQIHFKQEKVNSRAKF